MATFLIRSIGLFTSVAMAIAPTTFARDKTALADRLHAADMLTALDSIDAKPWHIKLEVQLFDEKGKDLDHGTIEEWQSPHGMDRLEYKTTSYTSVRIADHGAIYHSEGTGTPPYLLELLRQQVVHPMPRARDVEGASPELRKVAFGKVSLECIMLTRPMKNIVVPMGLYPTYCFDPGKDMLRASFEFGQQAVLRNQITAFEGRAVARDISVRAGKVLLATAQVTLMEAEPIPESEYVPSSDMVTAPDTVTRVSSGLMAGSLIFRPDPIYPASAKANHISGSVVLRAIIGSDGHIHALQLMSAPDPDLAIASIAAVRNWIYKPYLLRGAPIDVETTITVNFAFGN